MSLKLHKNIKIPTKSAEIIADVEGYGEILAQTFVKYGFDVAFLSSIKDGQIYYALMFLDMGVNSDLMNKAFLSSPNDETLEFLRSQTNYNDNYDKLENDEIEGTLDSYHYFEAYYYSWFTENSHLLSGNMSFSLNFSSNFNYQEACITV